MRITGCFATRRVRFVLGACLLLAAGLLGACSSKTRPASTPKPAAGRPGPAGQAPARDPSIDRLEERNKDLELRLLERDSELKAIKDRLEAQQGMLDEAIQEVVRAKAKLLSHESRAEAASQMAESEIALKALEEQSAGAKDPDLAQIRQLLQMGSQEFEKGNFGGALYLTIQAKGRIQAAQMRLRATERAHIGADEAPFMAPLPLKVTRSSNLREQPDAGSTVVVTLEPGTLVTGYSHKGEWVRVVCDDGARGWIHQSLLSGR